MGGLFDIHHGQMRPLEPWVGNHGQNSSTIHGARNVFILGTRILRGWILAVS